jgi:general secretion pathway protein E
VSAAGDVEPWPPALARRHRAALRRPAPGSIDAAHVLIADREPEPLLQQLVADRLRAPLRWQQVDTRTLEAELAAAGQSMRLLGDLPAVPAGRKEAADELRELSAAALDGQAAPAVRWLDAILHDALQDGASDLHLEARPGGGLARVRIDGVLQALAEINGSDGADTFARVISRLKVMAELDIGERRLPQDGRFRLRLHEREVDFRLSIVPGSHGENAVIRVLDRAGLVADGSPLSLRSLGFDDELAARLRALARAPHGLLLVTGPTGSGKTTTLYAALAENLGRTDKVVTIEDPVEYALPGVVQIPVNEKKGLSFAVGLRAILRHDPDRILVGEIRDAETAAIAVQAALTGHLVYSTVHANQALDVIARFLHLGLDPYHLVASLNVVLAQRLLRQRCTACGGSGCTVCRGSGYRGRRAVCELLVIDDRLRDLIVGRASLQMLKQAARETGWRPLREAALAGAAAGWTTAEEVDRVIAA